MSPFILRFTEAPSETSDRPLLTYDPEKMVNVTETGQVAVSAFAGGRETLLTCTAEAKDMTESGGPRLLGETLLTKTAEAKDLSEVSMVHAATAICETEKTGEAPGWEHSDEPKLLSCPTW
ncbi:MAG: hypothetical protein JJ863_24560 [Deltaproteobacteria bacterium]|nr:hypothetical protein [Deltaproteobacteria bacterium]